MLLVSLPACAPLTEHLQHGDRPPGMPRPPSTTRAVPTAIAPLPGRLDDRPVFNSNSPEIITEPGITLSTMRPLPGAPREAFLSHPVSGLFTVFSHHIAKDARPGDRLLVLGLLAHNRTNRMLSISLLAGSSYLSQPEAPFVRLPSLVAAPTGGVFAGPGDRVAGDLLRGDSGLTRQSWRLAPGSSQLLCAQPIPTDVAIPPPINGRTTQLRLWSSGATHLSEVALFAAKRPDGSFETPTLADFEAVLRRGQRAGPLEPPATPPQASPSTGAFRYGRVAGVTQGDAWRGDLTRPVARLAAGERIGFPIAAVLRNRLGTEQVQSAPLRVRYPDSAYAGHGNYGVLYRLSLRLTNPDATPRAYTVRLSQPLRVEPGSTATQTIYLEPPEPAVTFRGLVRVDEAGATRYTHLVLRRGQQAAPFETIAVAGGASRKLVISLIYPADATPPQLLTIERI
ncbi:MAG: DUF3370 domain-containing protein [Candidatus Sericytochromatia bacterium]|nr:DUF3370 domain-containing protein [Candidatus Sericytochromatia bacterium]